MWPCIVTNAYNKTNLMHYISQIYFVMKLCMFRKVPLSIIRSFSLYTQQWCVIQVCWQLASRISMELPVLSWSCSQAVSKPVWHIPLLCVQWKTPDGGQRNCPKHAELHSKMNLRNLVHQVGFIIRILIQSFKNMLKFSVAQTKCESLQVWEETRCFSRIWNLRAMTMPKRDLAPEVLVRI